MPQLYNTKSITCGLDIGYGNTKYASQTEMGLFPSLVAPSNEVDLGRGLSNRDTVKLESIGRSFEVGPSINSLLSRQHTPILTTDFTATEDYRLLFRAALSYLDLGKIDMLVMGLPISLVSSKKQKVQELAEGKHELANGQEVLVNNCIVVAQPIGSLIHYAKQFGKGDTYQNQRHLIIDAGFFTFDWVISDGITPNVPLSGNFHGGVSSILQKIGKELGKDWDTTSIEENYINNGLITGNFRMYGNPVSLQPYIERAIAEIEQPINALNNIIGSGSDIDNIIVAGGGAPLYLPALKKRFPDHQIDILPDPIFANAKGFHSLAEMAVEKKIGDMA